MSESVKRSPHHVVWDKKKIAEYWDVFGNIKPVSPWFSVKASGFILKELVKLKKEHFPDKTVKILDMGSGSGDLINSISKLDGFECYGIDLSSERVERAKRTFPLIDFRVGSLTDSGHKKGFFDIVITTQTIEHLLDEDLCPAFREMSDILAHGGLMFMTTRFEEDLTSRLKVCPDCHCIFLHSQHLQSFSIDSISELITNVDCEPIIAKRSRCRDHLKDYLPREIKFLNGILFFLFSKFMDRRKGKYLYAVGKKK